jgi:hypothetical protein
MEHPAIQIPFLGFHIISVHFSEFLCNFISYFYHAINSSFFVFFSHFLALSSFFFTLHTFSHIFSLFFLLSYSNRFPFTNLFLSFIAPSLSYFIFPSFYFLSIYPIFYLYIQFHLIFFPPRTTVLFWSWDATQGLPASVSLAFISEPCPQIHARGILN